jgi:hypothetical protein
MQFRPPYDRHTHQPASRRKNMNLELIAANLAEALHELEDLLETLGHPGLTVRGFKFQLEHILLHLVLAWNMRHLSNGREATLSDEEWDKYWTMPSDLRILGRPEEPIPVKPNKGKFDRQWARRYLHRHWTRRRR